MSYRLVPLGVLLSLATPALAQKMVVAELFTSQSCSSCPPADALLGAIKATERDVLVLDFHVDYWNHTGWRDPFSLAAATERQQRYARLIAGSEVYTPQLVIDGSRQVVGSDKSDVLTALNDARAKAAGPALALERTPDGLAASVAAGSGTGDLWLVGYDALHQTAIGGGENTGRTLTETNVVRALWKIGAWDGTATRYVASVPQGEQAALLLQAPDGRILAVATLVPAS